jgi:hypothetical protein
MNRFPFPFALEKRTEAMRSTASRTFSFELAGVAEFPGRPSQNLGAVMERFKFCG